VLVEARSSSTGLRLTLAVNVPAHENIYEFAELLISKLRLGKTETGDTYLKLLDESEQDVTKPTGIIYKKAHFISNRYFIVTVSQIETGTMISAFEPDKSQTLEFTLNRRTQLRNNENTHE
jgi:hypothetical protein